MLIGIDARMYAYSGIGTYLKALLKGLEEIDRENRYICYFLSKDLPKSGPPNENFTYRAWDVSLYSVKEQISLPARIRKEPFDLFHFPHYAFPILTPCKMVITIHDIIHYLFPQYLPNRMAHYYARFMTSACLKRGNRIITDSENTKSDLVKHFHADPQKVCVIYPGLPEESSGSRSGAEADVVKKFGLQNPYLLYVGNGKEHKNIPLLIRAFNQVRKRLPCHLVISCGKEEIKGAGELVENLNLHSHITFLGHVERDELLAIYQNAALFAFPSLYEGFGYPPLEAMARGVPVVCSNASSLPEVLGDAALLVPPNSVDLFSDSIYNVLTDKPLRESLIQKGLERSRGFNYQTMVEQTLEVYREAGRK